MYSVVLLAAMTAGGDSVALGHRHGGGCCGESACGCEGGGRRHHRGGGCGESYGCGCNGGYAGGCGSCGYAGGCGSGYAGSYGGCATCANGFNSMGAVVMNEAPATIVVSLPADAKLTIDDAATVSTSERRIFVSPNLPTGQEFHYTLKAEVQVDGKAQQVTKVVTVRAGEQTEIQLAAPVGVASR